MKAFSSISSLMVLAGALVACSASSGPSGEAVGNGGDSGAGNSTSSGGTGGVVSLGGTGGTGGVISVSGSNSGGSAANECGVQTFVLERKPAEVLLVLDRSFSMDDAPEGYLRPDGTPETTKKWDLIIPALLAVVAETNDALSWGLKVFPEGEFVGECAAGSVTPTIDVEIAENNAAAVIDRINATNDHGDGTPTGDALGHAVDYLRSREGLNDYNRYILLATDGEPSCINVTETQSGIEGQPAARPYAVNAITQAAGAGFPTVVVGVGTNKTTARDALNAMAVAGGATADCANPLADCFYLGNSRDQLTEDLRAIATGITSCTFNLTATPPDVDNVRVTLDGEKVNRDPNMGNGWEYTDPAKTIIEVSGQACDDIKASGAANVDIVFGCPDIDVR